MSRNDGSGGDSSIAARDERARSASRPSAVRRSHSVWRPDLAVGVHLGPPRDLAEVAVGVAARAGVAGARAARRGRRRPGSRSPRCGSGRSPPSTYLPTSSSPAVAGVACSRPVVDEVVHRVPVAPGLAHRAGLLAVERRVAVGVDDQPVRQPVRVLVVDDRRRRRRRWTARNGSLRPRSCPGSGTGTSASSADVPSGGVVMFALSMWLASGQPRRRRWRRRQRVQPITGSLTGSKLPRGGEADRRALPASRGSC